jgi:predicted ATPase
LHKLPGRSRAAVDGATSAPLVGRAAELERLGAILDEVARGSGRLAIIEGEPGIGKTRLVQWVAGRAGGLGIDVLEGRADELGVRHPYHALIDWLRVADPGSESELAGLLRSADAERSREFEEAPHGAFRAAQALLEMLEARSGDAPTLLVVEDLQWADSGTLTVLREASRHLRELSVLLLVSLRPVPRSPGLGALIGTLQDERADELELGPLSGEEVLELTGSVVGVEPGPNLVLKVDAAGGNPLFVIELLAALQAEGLLEAAEGRPAEIGDAAGLPTSEGRNGRRRDQLRPRRRGHREGGQEGSQADQLLRCGVPGPFGALVANLLGRP